MQYNFNIEIPEALLAPNTHNEIDFTLLEGKTILGLCGYKKSGKDAIATQFVEEFGFKRIAFADSLKIEMNKHMKELVRKDLGWSEDIEIDFLTEDKIKKPTLRPYIIWFGEKLRSINGLYFWINRAFTGIKKERIVVSDVRRLQELEIFEHTLAQWKKKEESFNQAKAMLNENLAEQISAGNIRNYNANLFLVNQFQNVDNDILTMECIRVAQEQWLFDGHIYLDHRIPEDKYGSSTKDKVKKLAAKYKIKKLTTVEKNQVKMFN